MTEQASQWTIGDGGRPKRSTTTRALGPRKHPDDGLRCHLSLIRRSATPPPPCGQWGLVEATMARATVPSPLPTAGEVDRLYH
jgi:hypothetical protein